MVVVVVDTDPIDLEDSTASSAEDDNDVAMMRHRMGDPGGYVHTEWRREDLSEVEKDTLDIPQAPHPMIEELLKPEKDEDKDTGTQDDNPLDTATTTPMMLIVAVEAEENVFQQTQSLL